MSITLHSDTPDTAKIKVNGNDRITIGSDGEISSVVVTVSQLPEPASIGAKMFVSDALGNSFNSIVAGGGSNKVPVFFDGVDWRIG